MKCNFIFSPLAKDLKNLDMNSILQLDVTWEGVPYLENTFSMNSCASPVASIDLVVGMKMACLVSQSTITRMSV